ncbi:TonB-dependent receptor [Chryseobacterium sp. SSA4.19]|uniref:TonB-dependent receptor plug domain-containing protein n=1 Tax=Chryseobacterium sp. SSA4.19 TaxID=2919915 RepID=UPI001F4DBFB8|nr:TonB-dependent receptor plug domain-containing protein [Chryseobacterium sp. SSA4.19]MCJ8155289.1 TonB-dependent receptor [Chryseobacterium sp. SSA4.19]
MNKHLYSPALIFLLATPISIFSQSSKNDTVNTKVIESIIINMKRQETGVISSQKLSGTELEKLNSTSVADAVRYFSGIQIKDYGGIGGMKTVNIRAMGSQHVGVFYDGIPIGNAQNGTVDLGRFSLDNLESISLYNGQKSEIFQAAKDFGSSGSIYLQSRTPVFKGSKKTNFNLNYRSGSFGVVNPSVLFEQKLSNKVSLSLNTEYLTGDGKYKYYQRVALPDGSLGWERKGIRENGDIEALRAEAGVFGKISNGSWKLKTYYYDSERGVPGAIIKNGPIPSSRQWDTNFFVQGSFEKEISPKYKFLINSKFADDYTHYYNDNPSGTPILIDNTYKQQEFYISTAHQYSPYKFWKINLSADYQYNTLDANLRQFAYPQRNTELIALATQFDLKKFKLQGSVLGTFVQEKIENTNFSIPQNRSEFTPTVFASYQPFATDFKIHGFFKRIFRMPTFNDLYYADIGSSQLKPEFTNQYDLGFTFNKDFQGGILKNINLIADAYYNKIHDKIIAVAREPFRWEMSNLGEVEIKGADVSAQAIWLISENILFSSRFTYTFTEALNITKGNITSYYRNQIPYTAKNNGSMLLGLTYKEWQLNYSYIYVGERYNMSQNIPENYEQPWYSSDISGTKEFNLKNWKFRLGLEVNNLLNQNYSVIRNYAMPGRNYRVNLRIMF